ncbi:hypothetical protein AiwAL_12295 [Acidiphilium sp. AL]|uniref:Uncharacterized protein n=1 Tax=Acidiphilium iwatense TaxID=768198 RepID=A0ABS9DY02_9PROT|nr:MULTISPECIES: hypothetical protein [Acidiphilium]MCF3947629.1 hypothetical protein [Acidiphilium iwatense]MCU4160881.1 hypothetical protein [Acidiphilium sp. AL]
MTIRTILRATIPALALTFAVGAVGTAHATSKKKKAETATSHATMSHAKLPGYKTEAAAKAACGMGGVVWHATGSKAFHGPKSKYFGKTKHGAYVCEKAALADHLHEAKN